jgi:hypothetical protein
MVAIAELGQDRTSNRECASRLAFFLSGFFDRILPLNKEGGMDQAIVAPLALLNDEVQAAEIPEAGKQTALWCIGRLPALYAMFLETRETRYGDEITRMVQAVLINLNQSSRSHPAAKELGKAIPERLQLLHEQLGIPSLVLPRPAGSTSRSRKAG